MLLVILQEILLWKFLQEFLETNLPGFSFEVLPWILQEFTWSSSKNCSKFLQQSLKIFFRKSPKNFFRVPLEFPSQLLQEFLWSFSKNIPQLLQEFLWRSSRNSFRVSHGISMKFLRELEHHWVFRISTIVPPGILRSSSSNASRYPPANPLELRREFFQFLQDLLRRSSRTSLQIPPWIL